MKTKPDLSALTKDPSAFLEGGAVEKTEKISNEARGRKPSGIVKEQVSFHLPLEIKKAIKLHCGGNQSFFVEKILREYFQQNDML